MMVFFGSGEVVTHFADPTLRKIESFNEFECDSLCGI